MKIGMCALGLVGFLAIGCGAGPAAPFNQMKSANVIALRLQNFEPPAPVGPAAATPQQGMIPGLPPEIAQFAQQALPALQQFLPPGLLPPGAMAAPTPAAPPPPDAPRFPMNQPNFRILNQTQVLDPDLKEQLADLLGDEDNFQSSASNCMYAEMGISFSTAGGPLNDLLISFSCNQVEARSFAWPHPNRGMTSTTVKKLAELSQKIWPS